ncbi:MAG: cytochrome b/b6 domain-containing protein [Bacteroidales bacterium]|nr:cytochrome b/b6 domain-containing protein [Bacteroidales bacterium]
MKTYIWTLPTRIFHWLLVIGMVAAYIVSEEEELLHIHSSVGYAVGILLIFRIIWGFAGPKYSRFSDFPIGFKALKSFFTDMKKSKSHSPGHNPAAALVMLGIILLGLMIVVSGSLLLASKGQGFFSSVSIGLSSGALKEIHEISVNVVIALVIFHLLGNLVDFISNRKVGTLQSMFTGYKNIEGESVQLSTFQKILAAIGIISAIAIFPYSEINQNIDVKSENNEQQLKVNEDEDEDSD